MRQVPDRSNHLPEDDLPSWVLYTEDCPDCSGTIDEGHNYSEYDMEVCSCHTELECAECQTVIDEGTVYVMPNDNGIKWYVCMNENCGVNQPLPC
jgi:hypothetical protein